MIRVPLPTTVLIAPAAIPAATIANASSRSMRRRRSYSGAHGTAGTDRRKLADAGERAGRRLGPRSAATGGGRLRGCPTRSTTRQRCATGRAGCDRVLALSSVGGLRPELGPGTILCPDDFIALDADTLTALEGSGRPSRAAASTPRWRGEVLGALAAAGIDAVDGGVYWQVRGPRLETPAEVRFDRRRTRR